MFPCLSVTVSVRLSHALSSMDSAGHPVSLGIAVLMGGHLLDGDDRIGTPAYFRPEYAKITTEDASSARGYLCLLQIAQNRQR